MGVLELLEQAAVLYRIDGLIGDDLSWYIQYGEEDPFDDQEQIRWKEIAELQIKYCQLVNSFKMEARTQEIKKRFEAGLDFLRVSLQQESVTVDQEVT